jgi:SAM-dependent methyltransferase
MNPAAGPFVQFGCGLSCPDGWINFDASPVLRLRAVPAVGSLLVSKLSHFPRHVLFGDIVRGLPLPENSTMAVFSSHVIEHLDRTDVPTAFKNVHRILRSGGIFRSVLPDISKLARGYLDDPKAEAGVDFIASTGLVSSGRKGISRTARQVFGHSEHRWMWDFKGLRVELEQAGFSDIREARFGDSVIPAMRDVESLPRFEYAFCFEARK